MGLEVIGQISMTLQEFSDLPEYTYVPWEKGVGYCWK
jgi:hypothetical protein